MHLGELIEPTRPTHKHGLYSGYAPHAFGTLPVPLHYTTKEPSQPKHSNNCRYTPTTTTVSLMLA